MWDWEFKIVGAGANDGAGHLSGLESMVVLKRENIGTMRLMDGIVLSVSTLARLEDSGIQPSK